MTEHSRPLAAVLHPDKKLPAYRVILSHPVCGQLVFSDFTRFWGLFCHDLVGQSVHLGFRSSIGSRADGDHVLADRDVLHAFQLGAHEFGSHGGPGAVLHQADGTVLERLGLEVGQQGLHRREEEAVIGGAGQNDLSAAECLGDGFTLFFNCLKPIEV